MTSHRLLLAAGALCACASVSSLTPALAAAPPRAHATSTTTVTLKDISFKRSTVKIARGASVKWVWKDGDTPHNVTFATKHSKTQKSGSYTLRFARTGTFTYHCTIHPGMNGKVVVG
ncbi:MAG: plastocyanin/azurin family copper-binding protein [Baekduia sp.]